MTEKSELVNDNPAPNAVSVLEYLAKSLVDEPAAVHVDAAEKGTRVELLVRVSPPDVGRLIGKRGRVANSIRTIVRAAAARDGVEVDVEFLD